MKSITYKPLDDKEGHPYFYGVTLKRGDKYYEPDYDIDFEEFKKEYLSREEWYIHEMHQIAIQTDDERILVEIALNNDRLLPSQGDEDFDPNAPGEAAASKIKSDVNVKKIINKFISEIELWDDYSVSQDMFEYLIYYLNDEDRFKYFEEILERYPRSKFEDRNYKSENCEYQLLYLIKEEKILELILTNDKYVEFHHIVKKKMINRETSSTNNN